ncbi:MAG: LpxL/LpxP family acyltransferase [Giesbergeria sp.]
MFPASSSQQRRQWAHAHLAMLAEETMDASALQRVGQRDGPEIELAGWEHVEALVKAGRGFILVLNHFDRLLAAPIALALRGLTLNTLTMPVLENPDLGEVQRQFLMRKIGVFTRITKGQWRTSAQSLRPVHESLRAGQAWIILADVWDADFTRLRGHRFLGGELRLPTGIERLAQSTGAALLHGVTYSRSAASLSVVVNPLPEEPKQAIDQAIEQLHADVRERPWAWWHWGQWDQMWHPATQEGQK